NRLQKWFDANRLPLKIKSERHGFRLTASSPIALLVQDNLVKGSAYDLFLQELNRHFFSSSFSATEVSIQLSIPRRSAIRLLGEAVAKGDLLQSGRARATRYTFSQGIKKAA